YGAEAPKFSLKRVQDSEVHLTGEAEPRDAALHPVDGRLGAPAGDGELVELPPEPRGAAVGLLEFRRVPRGLLRQRGEARFGLVGAFAGALPVVPEAPDLARESLRLRLHLRRRAAEGGLRALHAREERVQGGVLGVREVGGLRGLPDARLQVA